MGFISGKMVGHTKGIFRMIIEMDMENCSISINAYIKVSGRTERKLMGREYFLEKAIQKQQQLACNLVGQVAFQEALRSI